MVNRLEMQQATAVTHILTIQKEASSAGLRYKNGRAATHTLKIQE